MAKCHLPDTDFDLSRHESLSLLEITAGSLNSFSEGLLPGPPRSALRLLKSVLGSIRYPGLFRVVIDYFEGDFRGIRSIRGLDRPCVQEISLSQREREARIHHERFKLLCEAHKSRGFLLILRALVRESVKEYVVRELKEAVATEKSRGGFEGFSYEPLVEYHPRRRLSAGVEPL